MLIETMYLSSHTLANGVVSLCSVQGFNGADLRNVCTEAGMSAIRAERDYVIHEDFMKVMFSVNSILCCFLKKFKAYIDGIRWLLFWTVMP